MVPGGGTSIRADFVDIKNRPGDIESLYFNPKTWELTAEGSGTKRPADSSITIYYAPKVVNGLPASISKCPKG